MNTVVSGALDRLHYEKDPCVKYDIGRKLWIYLHRSRSQEEFGNHCLLGRVKVFYSAALFYTTSIRILPLSYCLTYFMMYRVSAFLILLVKCIYFVPPERIHQAQAAAAKARKALQQKPKPSAKPVSHLLPDLQPFSL